MGFVLKEEYYASGNMELTISSCIGVKIGRARWAKDILTGNPVISEGYNTDEFDPMHSEYRIDAKW